MLEIIYGLLHIEKGAVYWNNIKLLGPKHYLIPGEYFMKYLPQDFDLMPYITVEENIGKNISSLDPNKQQRIKELLEVVDMTEFLKTKVKNLSGGNQQKVQVSKWLFVEPKILILDEPTRGIDVGAKYEIYTIINDLVARGMSIMIISSELPEILGMCDRVYVIAEGVQTAEFDIEDATPEKIMESATV